MMISRRQIIKSLGLTLLGAMPGMGIWAMWGATQGLVLCGLGTFIGFAFSLPGVSPSRVAGLTAGVIVAHNVPARLGDKVMDHFTGGAEDNPPAPASHAPSEGAPHADAGRAM